MSGLIESALRESGCEFGGWALTRSAMRILTHHILEMSANRAKTISIVELGGGQSTIFWKQLADQGADISVITFEHDPVFFGRLGKLTSGSAVTILPRRLVQYSDSDWERIFNAQDLTAIEDAIANAKPSFLPESGYTDYRAHNIFYETAQEEPALACGIDALVVDGPHGNGRSLAFAIFAKYLAPGSIVLIDDANHYPFLEHLHRIASFSILNTSFSLDKQWIIVQIISILSHTINNTVQSHV